MNLGVVPVIPAAPIIVMCRERGGCTLPGWVGWLLHWPGLLALGAGILLLLGASWWWAFRC